MTGSAKIRVIIVDDIAETRENIRKLLQFENDIEVVGIGRTGKEGIDLAKEVKPDVVLMDINMPDMDGIKATEQIRKVLSFVQIIILSVQNDTNYMRGAMQAGACDFLAKPPTVDELTSAIRRAGKMAFDERSKSAQSASQAPVSGPNAGSGFFPGRNGKIITIYSPKGGAGTTTLVTNLAITLHSDETPTCIVDGNLQFGDVAIFLNEQSKFSVVDLAPRAMEADAEMVENLLMKHSASGIKVLAAPHRPEYAENVNGEQFGKMLEVLRRFFSYVVVDTSSWLTDITLSTMDITDILVLITTQDIPAIKSARIFLDVADAMDISRRRIIFTMNRFDKRIGIMPEKIGESFKQELLSVIPFDDRTVIFSVNRGIPFMLGNRSTPIGRAMSDLANLIQKRLVELDAPEVPAADVKGAKKKTN